MPTATTARRAFIQSMTLADSEPVSLLGDAGDPTAAVTPGALISFVAGIPPGQKNDILNSILFAQLAASAQYDREDEPVEWYGFYRFVLENVGWVIPNYEFKGFSGESTSFTAQEAILDLIAALAGQSGLDLVKSTLSSFSDLSDEDKRVLLFSGTSANKPNGSFQVSPANISDGVVQLTFGTFYYKTDVNVTRVLFFRFENSRTEFFVGGTKAELNEEIYKTVRQDILDKLGDNARRLVLDLPLATG